jgi:hypothetical protein
LRRKASKEETIINRRPGLVKRLLVLAMMLCAFHAYAGGKAGNNDTAEVRDILGVIEQNLQAAEEEDFDAWMKTYHERARSCKARGSEMLECFRVYDMKYALEQAKVLDRSDDEARVYFIQLDRTVTGPDNNDKRVTGVHIMKKSYGKWKIYDTEIKRIQELR